MTQVAACDSDIQELFLSFLHNGLSDADRDMLSAPITKEEIFRILVSMALNKTPGMVTGEIEMV